MDVLRIQSQQLPLAQPCERRKCDNLLLDNLLKGDGLQHLADLVGG